jgi:hypothetical protein
MIGSAKGIFRVVTSFVSTIVSLCVMGDYHKYLFSKSSRAVCRLLSEAFLIDNPTAKRVRGGIVDKYKPGAFRSIEVAVSVSLSLTKRFFMAVDGQALRWLICRFIDHFVTCRVTMG